MTSRLSSTSTQADAVNAAKVRLDQFLWAARFFKTRSMAADEIKKGRVSVGDAPAKPSREVKVGDLLSFKQGLVPKTVEVLCLSAVRGPAPVAQTLYTETPESVQKREKIAELRRQNIEPAQSLTEGRPTKRDRRAMDAEKNARNGSLNDRWTSSLD
jgi:ribosome-associated heat shock protein Hsp15